MGADQIVDLSRTNATSPKEIQSPVATYRIPDHLPRETRSYHIARLEQISRIRYEAIESDAPIRQTRDLSIAHARLAGLTEPELGIMTRVFNRFEQSEQDVGVVSKWLDSQWHAAHPDTVDSPFSLNNPVHSEFAATLLYQRQTAGSVPTGHLYLEPGRFGYHFITDSAGNFPQRNPRVTGGVIDWGLVTDGLPNVYLTFEITDDLNGRPSVTARNWVTEEEATHVIENIIDRQLTLEGITTDSGLEDTVARYRELAFANAGNEPIIVDMTNPGANPGVDHDAYQIAEQLPEIYRLARSEILTHMEVAGIFGLITPEQIDGLVTQEILNNFDFLDGRIAASNRYYRELEDMVRADIQWVCSCFVRIAEIYQGDYILARGILDFSGIKSWRKIEEEIKDKVGKYGLPDLLTV